MTSKKINVPIDQAGRIVLPKSLRKQLNISAGDEFQVSIQGQTIYLEPLASMAEPTLVKKSGVLVYCGSGASVITNEMLDDARSERLEGLVRNTKQRS